MSHVYIGMSGGVDSSVAALLLQQAGHQVAGIHLRLVCGNDGAGCAQDGARDAQAVADRLQIPLYTEDLSEAFRRIVMSNFIEEYEAGRTPNPCVVCNRHIKFGAMLDLARTQGANYLATGHYARVDHDASTGRWRLLRGADRSKDQSYFLYALTQDQLAHTLFPLGEMSKPEIRQIAEDHGLVNAHKRDSQDICFVPDGDYVGFIARTTGHDSPAGDFVDQNGHVLGQHKGFVRYTRGQHKGLALSIEPPLYVLDKDPQTNTICLGPNEALFERELTAKDVNWISIAELTAPMRVTAKTRHSQREAAATAEPLADGRIRVIFDEPQRAITCGQAVVLYDGDVVVGGGTICK